MKYVDKYSKEELLDQLNNTRQALMAVCENIFKFLGKDINEEKLYDVLLSVISMDTYNKFYHMYIRKDYTPNFLDDVNSDYQEKDDLEELKIL